MQNWIADGNIATELKPIGTSGKVATTSIAVDRDMTDRDGKWIVDFINLRFIGEKNVSRAQKTLSVGTHVNLRGKVCHEAYTDKNGEKRYSDYVLVSEFKAARKNSKNEDGGIAPVAEESPAPAQKTEEFINIPDSVSDDGMPFN